MKDFRRLNNLYELKQSLQKLKSENSNLLDIYDQTNNSYFADLLNSPLMQDMYQSPKILEAISNAKMAFNIGSNPLLFQSLFSNLFFYSRITDEHDKAIKILVKKFGLTANDQVYENQTIAERFILQSDNTRLAKTLKNLVESNLLPDGMHTQYGLPLLPLNIANVLAKKITDTHQLQEVIILLKHKYDLNELACSILKHWSVPTDLALKEFTYERIKIDFNIPSQDQVSGTALQILADKYIPYEELGRTLYALSENTIDWNQNSNGGMDYMHNFMSAYIQNGAKFVDTFIVFRGKATISDMLKAYEGQEIDFDTTSQELEAAAAIIHQTGLEVPMAEQESNTNLLAELFNYINDREQLKEVTKLLSPYENINWNQQLKGVNGDNILSKIAAFEGIYNNVEQLLRSAKDEYALTFKINNATLLAQIVDQINYNQEPNEIINIIEDLGFEVNKGLMSFVFADRKNISLPVALDFFPDAQFAEILIQDLPLITRTITKDNNFFDMQASFYKLVDQGFNQWADDFGNGQQFLGNIIQNCSDLLQVEQVLSILSKVKDIPWDFSHRDAANQDVFDIMFMKPGYPDNMTNIIKTLAEFENIDCTEASIKFLDSPIMHPTTQLIDFVALLPEEKIDLLKVVNGKTLIANLLSRAKSNEELQTLMLNFKDKFHVDINSEIGLTQDHIISFIPSHLLQIDNLLPILNNLEINIDWLSTNQQGIPLFVKVLQNSQQNIQVNLNYFMANIDQAEWTQPLDNEKNNLPLWIIKSGEQNWDTVINLLKEVDEQNNPLFNINYKNDLGIRLIDQAELLHSKKVYNAHVIIKELRDLGSVEPQKSISFAIADRLDLSNGRLDAYQPNKDNVSKIMNLLFQKFPLSEEQVTQEINDYKSQDFEGWNNYKWNNMNTPLTIPRVIDELSKMTDVHDRLPQNWSFKKVLGHIIHVVRTSNDEGLSYSLTHCLSELYMCNLGKLINLISVAQDQILEEEQVNYSGQNFEDFHPILEASLHQVKLTFQDQSPLAITEWFYDIYGNNVPEKWGMQTIRIQGILNKVFAETGVKKEESYHFNNGLKAQIIAPLIEKIKPGSVVDDQEQVNSWQNILQQGISIRVCKFFEQIENAAIDELDSLFEDVLFSAETVYGDFSSIGNEEISNYYNKMITQDQEKALKFLELLKTNCTLNQDVIRFIDQEHGTNLMSQLIKEPIQASQIIEQYLDKYTTVDLRACSTEQIKQLLDNNINNEALIHQLITDENIKINWVEIIDQNKHTLLSHISHIAEGKYASDAINLYNSHLEEWQDKVHHNVVEIGQVDDQFGDLI